MAKESSRLIFLHHITEDSPLLNHSLPASHNQRVITAKPSSSCITRSKNHHYQTILFPHHMAKESSPPNHLFPHHTAKEYYYQLIIFLHHTAEESSPPNHLFLHHIVEEYHYQTIIFSHHTTEKSSPSHLFPYYHFTRKFFSHYARIPSLTRISQSMENTNPISNSHKVPTHTKTSFSQPSQKRAISACRNVTLATKHSSPSTFSHLFSVT